MMDDTCLLRDGERLDDLQYDGLRIIQRPDAFRFGTDSVILADFASPKPRERAIDLGCGTGVISILMAAHSECGRIDAVELQPDVADMAHRSVLLNHLEDRITVHNDDLRSVWHTLGAEQYNLAVCNPPYGKQNAGLPSVDHGQRLARHEGDLSPSSLCNSAFHLLRNDGRFCVVYPAPRAFEMMRAMDSERLAPKRIRTVHGIEGRAPRFVLIEAVKNGGEMLHWLPPLNLRHSDGSCTEEWNRIYHTDLSPS